MVMKLDKFLCRPVFIVFFGFDSTQNPTNTHFFRQDNQSKVSTNLFPATKLRTKNKRLCTVTVCSTSIATPLFLLLKFPGFHDVQIYSNVLLFNGKFFCPVNCNKDNNFA